ncbi:MAG: regulatory protein RecX [Pseudomonadales bacterium]|nr:regulatory protein RecX [Pseudomonadales bacterium]
MVVDAGVTPANALEQSVLWQKALAWLARREYSRRELAHKFARQGATATQIQPVLDALAERGLQSDVRFAEGVVSSRARRGQGATRICRELAECGVAAEVIDAALATAGIDWQRRALEVCREKFGAGEPTGWPERARRARFLSYRGFDTDIIRAVLAPGAGEDP